MKSKIMQGNCLKTLKTLPDNSVDSIITDPPYELGFMGKSWDATGIAFNVDVWQECLRVLKPGGHLLAFSGSRTYHRMACAIEDAGFQIRDQIMWVYGSGFPKSHNIGKAIDKAAGAERELIGEGPYSARRPRAKVSTVNTYSDGVGDYASSLITAPATAEAKKWDGWGTALKPAHEPIVMARKPLIGTVAENVLTYGVGGINIEACRVGDDIRIYSGGNKLMEQRPWNKNQKDRPEYVATGRFPANFIHDGSDEVVELFPTTKSVQRTGKRTGRSADGIGDYAMGEQTNVVMGHSDSGSAARFFYCSKASKKERNAGLDKFTTKTVHRYSAGIGEGLTPNAPAYEKNNHPTVKPLDLMRYLCKLVTPPSGIVLDPFTGSGSTLVAAKQCGYKYIGCELDKNYIKIARARLKNARKLRRKI